MRINGCKMVSSCFFFQAEDGIRDDLVTGVQTCALPISVEHDDAYHCRGAFAARRDVQIGDQVPHGFHATDRQSIRCVLADLTRAPLIKCADRFTSLKPVVTHDLHAVRREEVMGRAPVVEVDVMPICHLETMKGMPEKQVVVGCHRHPGYSGELAAPLPTFIRERNRWNASAPL